MWILNFIPDSWLVALVNSALVGSFVVLLACIFLSHIPFIGRLASMAKTAAIIVLLVSIYFKGSLSNELIWRARVAELEAKIKVAEEKSRKVNTVIKNRVVTKTKIVREKQIVIQEKIKEVEKRVNEKCEIDPAVIEIHNHAAETPGEAK
jgi:hypothetical protein